MNTSRTLPELRAELDRIDDQLLTLLEERFRITDEVAGLKNRQNAPLTDPAREAEMMSRLKEKAGHPALKDYIERIFGEVIQLNKTARVFNRAERQPFSRIAVLGLGMIGGSIVKALKVKNPNTRITTLARSSADVRYAVQHGYITDTYSDIETLVHQNDLIILATPIAVISEIAEQIVAVETDHPVTVIDVSSIKGPIGRTFEKLSGKTMEFVPTHPMAGSEKSGFIDAQAMLFTQKPWVICEHSRNSDRAVSEVAEFIQYLGSSVIHLSSDRHDELVASVSHLVFLISTYVFAYCNERCQEALPIAGSGFEGITRLASGNAAMHSQIYEGNRRNIQKQLAAFLTYLQEHPVDQSDSRTFFEQQKSERDAFITHSEESRHL